MEKEADHYTLPIKINLMGTREKLMAFLRYLEKTGNVADEKATRLLDVKDISVSMKDRGSSTKEADEVAIDLAVDAYFMPSL